MHFALHQDTFFVYTWVGRCLKKSIIFAIVKIYLTFDYELFFGETSGSVEKCLLQPTRDLLAMAEAKNVHYTFFVDVGYLVQAEKYPELQTELTQVKAQIKEIIEKGHSVQLHVHPHWEKATWNDGTWTMNVEGHYKLIDFSTDERVRIVTAYKTYLEELTKKPVHAFRAGGWCIQPFNHIQEVMQTEGVKYDTSVFPGGKMITGDYSFDFTPAPKNLGRWKFSSHECVPDINGYFTEIPIATYRYSPTFYWELFAWGRIYPSHHKFIGDGNYIPQPGRRKQLLTSFSWNHASLDGYYAKKMKKICKHYLKENRSDLVYIGHPKGLTMYSLRKLDQFIEQMKTKVEFTTFHMLE